MEATVAINIVQTSTYTSGYIRRWLDNIELNYENHTMPPTPPSTFARIPRGASARERRGSRQSTLTSDTQTPKATKTLTPETYRQINLRASCIFIDNKVIIPPAIDEYIRQILGVSSWEDQVPAPNGIGMQPLFDEVADKYHRESERLASTCSLEGDWRHCLYSVMCQMNNRLGQALEINACEKVWNQHLKPINAILQKRLAKAGSPGIDPNLVMDTDPDYSESISPSSQSVSTITKCLAIRYYVKTPKPDITCALTSAAFTTKHQNLLDEYQACELILSDPYAAESGIRFPFIIAELKANSPLTDTQNQAAVGGACILKILTGLTCQVSSLTTPVELPPALALCFSIVTEGPTHELWVHFKCEDAFHMLHLQSWRTTRRDHAQEFVNCLGRIIEWGKGDFKEHIVKMLDRLPNI
ncbi:hypothetical protein yc1106_08230 [Curvularia clavata]|uniref:DUF7924 domain-containing protein n=1 Tax=Curvularia clavata TaxID=95742 RepID=A0A9Q8ZF41_CURCL|nr:hypothetical protein yc1106_08230 [Curvularia clavata]